MQPGDIVVRASGMRQTRGEPETMWEITTHDLTSRTLFAYDDALALATMLARERNADLYVKRSTDVFPVMIKSCLGPQTYPTRRPPAVLIAPPQIRRPSPPFGHAPGRDPCARR